MKRHREVGLALVCSVLLTLCVWSRTLAAGQARSGKPAGIVGVWEAKTADGASILLLNADGSGEFNGKELQWTFNQNILSLSFPGDATYMYEAALAANSLVVNSADLKQPIKFTRSGSAAASEPANPLAGGSLAGPSAGGKSSAGRSAGASGPEGTWQVQKPNGMFTLVLDPGGAGSFNGNPAKWKLSQGILTLQWENGDVFMYNAALTANSLRVTGGNLSAPIEFQRTGSTAAGGVAAGGTRSRPASVGNSSGPVGHWETPSQNGTISLILNPDGSGTFGQGSVRWSYNQGILTLTGPNGRPIAYNATIGPDSMSLSGEGLDAPISFRRSGGSASASRGSLGGGGVGEDDEGVEEGEDAAGMPGQGPGGFGGNSGGGFPGGGNLTGSWQNQQGSSLQLNPDGTAVLNGQRFKYTSDGSTITLIGADGSMPFPYSLQGNTLTVSVQGQTAIYTRTGGAGGQGGRAGGSFGGGGNPPEMAGKWCAYSGSSTGQIISGREQCFTLYPNGTYEYYGASDSTNQYGGTASQSSDNGTWSVEGSTIVANSRSQGRVVYQLEKKNNKNNDPMLCLDGQCFVTYGQKPPWPY